MGRKKGITVPWNITDTHMVLTHLAAGENSCKSMALKLKPLLTIERSTSGILHRINMLSHLRAKGLLDEEFARLNKEPLPRCDSCRHCQTEEKRRQDRTLRHCTKSLRDIPSQSMMGGSKSPLWCPMRKK